jgi:hypothetical protein
MKGLTLVREHGQVKTTTLVKQQMAVTINGEGEQRRRAVEGT